MKRGLLWGMVLMVFVYVAPLDLAISSPRKIIWKAQSSYPAGLPQLYSPAAHFAKLVKNLTDGRLVVRMSPGGSIVPSKQVFEAVSTGVL
ncbi:MAG: hypothetical protein DRH15_07730, partial [Deltaproteobacteria bacterium]